MRVRNLTLELTLATVFALATVLAVTAWFSIGWYRSWLMAEAERGVGLAGDILRASLREGWNHCFGSPEHFRAKSDRIRGRRRGARHSAGCPVTDVRAVLLYQTRKDRRSRTGCVFRHRRSTSWGHRGGKRGGEGDSVPSRSPAEWKAVRQRGV